MLKAYNLRLCGCPWKHFFGQFFANFLPAFYLDISLADIVRKHPGPDPPSINSTILVHMRPVQGKAYREREQILWLYTMCLHI